MSIPPGLFDIYVEWCTDVSNAGMALSFQTSLLLWQVCEACDPISVADFGSGFSSYVVRRWAEGHDVKVTSVDDSEEWLAKTAAFLDAHGLDNGDLVTWDAYQAAPPAPHDVVLHDLAGGSVRESSMAVVAAQVSPGGMAIFDDAHHPGHNAAMDALDDRFWWINVGAVTRDQFGRFARLGVRR